MAKKATKSQIDEFQLLAARRARPKLVAHLLDRSPRWLRDASIPKNPDGETYDLRIVLQWAEENLGSPSVSDDDLETVLRMADAYQLCMSPLVSGDFYCLRHVNKAVRGLVARCGNAAYSVIGREIVEMFFGIEEGHKKRATEENAWVEEVYQDEWDRKHAELAGCVQCEKCRRYRHGTRWTERKKAGDVLHFYVICPDCQPPGYNAWDDTEEG